MSVAAVVMHMCSVRVTMQYQGCIKRRVHATPDSLHIDIEILDVTENSAFGCSRECTFTSIGKYCYSAPRLAHVACSIQCSTASPITPVYDRYG